MYQRKTYPYIVLQFLSAMVRHCYNVGSSDLPLFHSAPTWKKMGSLFQFVEGISFQTCLSDRAAVAGGSSVSTHTNSLQWLQSQTSYSTARTTVAGIEVTLDAAMNCKCSFNHCIVNSEPWFCFANKHRWGSWSSWTSEWMVHWDQLRRPYTSEKTLWIACSLDICFIFITKERKKKSL